MNPTTPLEAALAYAAFGLYVFPIEPQGKRPLGCLVPYGIQECYP